MPEALLYFIWQYQYFTTTKLVTTNGETIQVLQPGYRNHNSGPDFMNARLIMNDVEWVGTVEIHTYTSEWLVHRHHYDRAYDNVILHVVWHDDTETRNCRIVRSNDTLIPTLELRSILDPALHERYVQLLNTSGSISCASQFRNVSPLRVTSMLDKAMMQRLERKATAVHNIFKQTNQDWEETAYQLLATNMGFKINAEPMAQLSRSVPLKVLHKHRDVLTQVEAMLFGTAGLLEIKEHDEYVVALQREYRFLSTKYGLADKQQEAHVWKWGRLRPANFPTIRLAQLARLLTYHTSLFSLFIGSDDVDTLMKSLQLPPATYWQSHYRFGKSTEKAATTLGQNAAENIVINTVVTLLAAYAHHRGQPVYMDRAINLLEQLPAEKNHLTDRWDALGLGIRTAFDSQAAIELHNEFCLPKKCLNCQIGAFLIKS